MKKNEQIRAELDGIAGLDPEGVLRAEAVVEWARDNPKSALHSQFKWDDTEAARQYRLMQARQVIRVYVKILDSGKPEPTRAYVSLTSDRTRKGGGYREIGAVLSSEEMRKQLLADAYKAMRTFMAKYGHLQELAKVTAAIDEMIDQPAKEVG